MDVKLDKIEATDKEHVIYYIIADHYSSAFYTELRTNRTLLSPIEFLICAWKKKPDFFFHGVPEHLIVPATVSKKYPEIKNWLQQQKVGIVPPSSGFYAGVQQVKNWEKEVAGIISYHNFSKKTPCTLDDLYTEIPKTLQRANNREINRLGTCLTRKQLWEMLAEDRPSIQYID